MVRTVNESERRRKLFTRASPIAVLGAVAFLSGLVLGASAGGNEAPRRFADAWERQDFSAMHAELTPAAKTAHPIDEFTQLYVDAQSTSTAAQVVTDEVEEIELASGDGAAIGTTVDTYAFGQVAGRVELGLDEGRIDWKPHMVFPGLTPGEVLTRQTRAGERAAILARDGTALAEGPASARSSPLGTPALSIAGSLGSPSRKQEEELTARGFPPATTAGTSGLELAFNARLAGQPSGELLATPAEDSGSENRILASGNPTDGQNVKTTIDPELQESAVLALGSIYGGVAVLDARNGDVLGVAGLAFSAPQPPGSTFKIVTATAALEAGVVKTTDEFPIETSNSDIGREISNAGDSACGGTFVQSFANSCNTVFAPLGVAVGPQKLVETAELFGFNATPALANDEATEALAPPAPSLPDRIDGDVALGETAIGQGEVLATPLQMASVAQTIAGGGVRSPTSIVKTPELRPTAESVQVASKETADTIRRLMLEVVNSGTGTAAQVPGVQVAGKTGTAELGPKALEPGQVLAPGEDPPQMEDAWFTSFAPANKPKLAVSVLVVNAPPGGGGANAAPIAQQILASALG